MCSCIHRPAIHCQTYNWNWPVVFGYWRLAPDTSNTAAGRRGNHDRYFYSGIPGHLPDASMAARRTHPLSTANNYRSVGLQHGTHPVISGKNSSQTSIRFTSRVATGSYSPSRCRSWEEGCSRDFPGGGMMERIDRSYDSSKRMKARIKASRAGLEELTVLRHKQQQLVEQAKVLVTGMRTPVRRRSLPWMKQVS